MERPGGFASGWRAAVSPDGTQLVCLDAGWPVQVIWAMGTDGRNPRRLVVGEEGEQFFQVCWSPDGQRVAYGAVTRDGYTIKCVDGAGSHATTLVRGVDLFQHYRGILPFVWLPEGRLVFSRSGHASNQFSSALWVVTADPRTATVTGTPREIAGWAGFNVRDLRATRDGTRLSVLVERFEPSINIASLDEAGEDLGPPRRLTLDDRRHYFPSWTCDGRRVLFQSNRGGRFDLYAQDIDSPVAETLVVDQQDKILPVVTPDGHWLLFQHLEDSAVLCWAGTSAVRRGTGDWPSRGRHSGWGTPVCLRSHPLRDE